MPVLHRAVTPSAVDDPDSGQVEHGSELAWVNTNLVAQHGLHQGFLPLWTHLVAYRRSLVCHGGEDAIRALPAGPIPVASVLQSPERSWASGWTGQLVEALESPSAA